MLRVGERSFESIGPDDHALQLCGGVRCPAFKVRNCCLDAPQFILLRQRGEARFHVRQHRPRVLGLGEERLDGLGLISDLADALFKISERDGSVPIWAVEGGRS
jgi:hypothetical protein